MLLLHGVHKPGSSCYELLQQKHLLQLRLDMYTLQPGTGMPCLPVTSVTVM
jgi:hypothetical protein